MAARIRSLKPEIWLSPQVMDLSRDARLLFVGLITQADDEGRGVADPRKLKAAIFPGDDDITSARVVELLGEIERQGLAAAYEGNGHGRVYCLPSWRAHQSIDRPRLSAYPGPPHNASPEPRVHLVDVPTMTREGSDRSGSDRSGSEWKGMDQDSPPLPPPLPLPPLAPLPLAPAVRRMTETRKLTDQEFAELQSAYPPRTGLGQRWPQARSAINARLAEGASWNELLEGAKRYAAYCQAEGTEPKHVQQAATFFGTNRGYCETWDPPKKPSAFEQSVANMREWAREQDSTEPPPDPFRLSGPKE